MEDEWLVSQGIKEGLEDLGYEVVGVAVRGEEAIRLSAKHKPDLVFMDILLKGDMNGIEAARQICQHSDIPVIFVTAFSDPDTLGRIESARSSCLIKPIEVKELHSAIGKALDKFQESKPSSK